ncbi:MAG: helix-turn-helix domain-containing protein [Planctomycetota bacterium]
MSLTERFADALKRCRELAGLSQEQLASKARLDRTYVSQLERGLKSPTLTTLDQLSVALGIDARLLLEEPRSLTTPRIPEHYTVRQTQHVIMRRQADAIQVPALVLTSAVNVAHELIDDLYRVELDIASTLGLRNLSAFVGELVAAALRKTANGLFERNPHQDGYPDLLLMDTVGKAAWDGLRDRLNQKAPFSPFPGGGIEIKATCGSMPTPAVSTRRGAKHPALGDTRIGHMTGYDWKAHHRQTNNLIGLLWDFIDARPRIAAMFYSSDLRDEDWGVIVQPREGGGRTTSVSIMARTGIQKMYEGWLCVLAKGGYAEFLNRKNNGSQIPTH